MSETIKFDDWSKLDLKVGKILKVEDIEGADKLYKLEVDIGDEKRTICVGIKKFYSKDELKGREIIIFANLEPRVMRGIKSEGMLLAAGSKEENICVLIEPEKDVEVGSEIR